MVIHVTVIYDASRKVMVPVVVFLLSVAVVAVVSSLVVSVSVLVLVSLHVSCVIPLHAVVLYLYRHTCHILPPSEIDLGLFGAVLG